MQSRLLPPLTAALALFMASSSAVSASAATATSATPPAPNNLVWTTPSRNSSESMPCGGGDIGMNVWVENGDILFYIARSGAFDENNTSLKQGRVRIRLSPNPFANGGTFRQELKLEEGAVLISGEHNGIATTVRLWADVFQPVIHAEVINNKEISAQIFYENWRHEDHLLSPAENSQNSYRWAPMPKLKTKKDDVNFKDNRILFYHRNEGETVFDVTVRQQGLDSIKAQMFDPLKNLITGGILEAEGFKAAGISTGKYSQANYKAWQLESVSPLKQWELKIRLHTEQSSDFSVWEKALEKPLSSDKQKNLTWWKEFWARSFIHIRSTRDAKAGEIARNYHLFRYMLACNANGTYPTKFNGGLFTYDPAFIEKESAFSPDFRKWGGGTFTAQNQRLVYFPMLKSGDFDMMSSQFDFYLRALFNAEARSRFYWNHGGASFTEQLENFGLPDYSEYGTSRPADVDKGVEHNRSLEYLWDASLEFCFMILEKERYTGADISRYLPLVESCVRFFDEHYQYEAKKRGGKPFAENGKLILYPGSACERYKLTLNASSTIAALQTVSTRLLELPESYLNAEKRDYYKQLLGRLPEIRTREINGKTMISPAWTWAYANNAESPQLYPVYPWGIYGIGRPGLDVAINTYKFDPDVQKVRGHWSWTQYAIFAARLGLVDEAKDWVVKKLQNSGRRFPTFWGPGYDWVPDHNWGGSGMIALQEMLLQADGKKLFLLPTWPEGWDVHFKLHAPYNTTVECVVEGGKVSELIVTPKEREKDIIVKK